MNNESRCRVRDLGVRIGTFQAGRYNAITDVPGVQVGHTTLIEGEGPLVRGRGPVRTGVTAILPMAGNVFMNRVVGGGFVLHGAGEISGLTQVMEWGLIETPILLTNTLSVGRCSEALVQYMIGKHPEIGNREDVVIPVVGECDDSWLNDIAGRHVHARHVAAAIDSAQSGRVIEGSVGGGTGMVTCDFKGGIGTSSRRIKTADMNYVLGVLVMSNFGRMEDLRMDGVPVGRSLKPDFTQQPHREDTYGSIIAVFATDAPLLPNQVNRIAKRVGLGIGRAGSFAAHGSGEIIVGFSTANAVPRSSRKMLYRMKVLLDDCMDPLYAAAVDATEEAILNSMCMADGMRGADGHLAPALPLDRVRELLAKYRG
ncbi:MAG: P1 family peptidase [Elusimicrobiota bacterium]